MVEVVKRRATTRPLERSNGKRITIITFSNNLIRRKPCSIRDCLYLDTCRRSSNSPCTERLSKGATMFGKTSATRKLFVATAVASAISIASIGGAYACSGGGGGGGGGGGSDSSASTSGDGADSSSTSAAAAHLKKCSSSSARNLKTKKSVKSTSDSKSSSSTKKKNAHKKSKSRSCGSSASSTTTAQAGDK